MVMEAKTMKDVLQLTQDWHCQLSEHLRNHADGISSQRRHMLLDYLSLHEEKLSNILETFLQKSDLGALDTWLYEYTDRHKVIHEDPRNIAFDQMSEEEIAGKVSQLHNGLMDLYTHLYRRAESDSARDLMEQVLNIESSRTKMMHFGAQRMGEL